MTASPGSRARDGFAALSAGPLYYEVDGAGHPLVLLHAGIADSRMWDDQFDVFARRYRVIRYDMRGFGRTGAPTGPYSNSADLHELLGFLHVEKAYLLGLSMGGGLAVDYTLAYPAMVDALITVAAGVSGSQPSEDLKEQWIAVDAAVEQGDIDAANELELRLWVDGPRRSPDHVDPAVRERVRVMNRDNFALYQEEHTSQRLEPPAIARLGEVMVPTLVIVGDGDVPDVLASADLLATSIRGARKVVMPGLAHMPNMERPAEFNRIVLDFLGGL